MALQYNLNGEMTAVMGLCKERHPYPVEECIFPNSVAYFAFTGQESDAQAVLEPLVVKGMTRLVIYASGCGPALLSVINVAQRLKVREIVVMWFDAIRETYQPQNVTTINDIYK